MGNRIKTRRIGEQFNMGGVFYEVAEAFNEEDPCLDCSLNNGRGLVCLGDTCVMGFCYAGMRSDNKQVVFKEVGKKEKPLDSLLNGDFTGETSEVWN